jgi:threonylcarbamoyladenosine tRNA methylthiotransferase MtaB
MEEAIDSNHKRVAFHTLGCRLNMAETGSIAQGFKDRGYNIVPFGDSADVVMVNTCTVTDGADSTCRNLIRRAQKSSPEGKIAVVGCYAQMESQKISKMHGVDIVLGTAEKYKIFDFLDEETEQVIKVDLTNEFWGAATTLADNHTRAFLKIQDGCNYICSFCIIPQARGRSRAIGPNEALLEAKKLISQGFKEIILTGVNIGEYEKASGVPFHYLVEEILKLDGLERLRLSSVEPNTITDKLLEVLKSSPKFMDHFHIPLQSGNDQILSSMRRKYDTEFYRNIIAKIKRSFPDAAIGADIILGYPGESQDQFMDTFNLVKELPITHFHAFPFSKRQGTMAAKEENHIPHAVKKERVQIINGLGASKLSLFAGEMIGKKNNVLFEKRNKNGLFEGYTSNFVRIYVSTDEDLKNQIRTVEIIEEKNGELHGIILS